MVRCLLKLRQRADLLEPSSVRYARWPLLLLAPKPAECDLTVNIS